MLFSQFGINYNNLSPMFRKGSTLVRSAPAEPSSSGAGSATDMPEASTFAVPVTSSSKGQPGRVGLDEGKSATLPVSGPETVGSDALEELPGPAEVPPRTLRAKKPKKVRPFEGLTGEVVILHEDIIGDPFWLDRTWLLA